MPSHPSTHQPPSSSARTPAPPPPAPRMVGRPALAATPPWRAAWQGSPRGRSGDRRAARARGRQGRAGPWRRPTGGEERSGYRHLAGGAGPVLEKICKDWGPTKSEGRAGEAGVHMDCSMDTWQAGPGRCVVKTCRGEEHGNVLCEGHRAKCARGRSSGRRGWQTPGRRGRSVEQICRG